MNVENNRIQCRRKESYFFTSELASIYSFLYLYFDIIRGDFLGKTEDKKRQEVHRNKIKRKV